VAGAARSSRGQAACIGLLAGLWLACAKIEDPPGGPPDFTAPVILSITPDSGAVLDGFDDEFEIQFDEVISERSGSGLENLVLIAPRPEEVEVKWRRSRVTAKPKDGWHAGIVYHVSILPGFSDLRNNRLDSAITVIFSTGGPIPATALNGTVIDWEAGGIGARALVEAVLLPDSLVYFTRADSVGEFVLSAVPAGRYVLFATVDQNNNGMRDRRESFDSSSVVLDSAATRVLWTFAHDTLGPRVQEVVQVDSVTIRVTLSQMPDPEIAPDGAVDVLALPDSTPLAVTAVWTESTYDSVSAVERAIADSLARLAAAELADSLAADSLAADTSIVDTTAVERQRTVDTTTVVGTPDSVLADRLAADSTAAGAARIDSLLALRPKLSAVWYVRVESALEPGARYVVVTRATNLSSATLESLLPLLIPAPPDST